MNAAPVTGGEITTGAGTFADGKTFEFNYEEFYGAMGYYGFETCFSMNSDEKDSRFKNASYHICRSLESEEAIGYCMDGRYTIKDDNGTIISIKPSITPERVELGSVPCYMGSKVNEIKLFQEACAKAEQLNDRSIICSWAYSRGNPERNSERCLDDIINEMNDSSICGKMSFGNDYCYQQFSIKNKDLSLCGKISDKVQQDDCYIADFTSQAAWPINRSYDGATGKFRSFFVCFSFYGTIKEIKVTDKLDPEVSCKAVYEPDQKVEMDGNFSVDAECSGGTALKNKGDPYKLEIDIKFHGTLPDISDTPVDYQENGTLMGEAD